MCVFMFISCGERQRDRRQENCDERRIERRRDGYEDECAFRNNSLLRH